MASKLEGIWRDVTSGMPQDVTTSWWSMMQKKYSEEGRSYHNIQHLLEKFEQFENIKDILQNDNAIALSLFFQYFEYDPKSLDCEERNIDHFGKFADECAISKDSPLRSAVVELLQSATSHSTDAHKTGGAFGSEDRHFFLDIDMAVLGSGPERYADYIEQVQQEYSFLSKPIYKSLRLKVLQNFLQIPNIFASKEFRDKFEAQARANIQHEVDMLSK